MSGKRYQRSLYIFRRDLRLHDNTALNQALALSQEVATVFIFDPRQIAEHPYRSTPAFQFMLESLKELGDELAKIEGQLFFLWGDPKEVLRELISTAGIEAVFVNRDYTPFSIDRDTELQNTAEGLGASFHSCDDALLHTPGAVRTQGGTPFTVYTPFYKAASKLGVAEPQPISNSYFITALPSAKYILPDLPWQQALPAGRRELFARGGRSEALTILKTIKRFAEYDQERNVPSVEGTTGLSPHHKFGTISVRESYYAIERSFGSEHTLIRELYWRDFFTQVAFFFPHVFKGSFKRDYDRVQWDDNPERLLAWQEGRTGFPIVDAGMRQLAETGWMHNRVRMIVASFLVKDLILDWRLGERWFAKNLIDYDPAVNNGSWQWAASTGCDAQPFFRIFNPWSQQAKFDPEGIYVKQWVPELRSLPATAFQEEKKFNSVRPANYPRPIVDHAVQRKEVEMRFRSALGK